MRDPKEDAADWLRDDFDRESRQQSEWERSLNRTSLAMLVFIPLYAGLAVCLVFRLAGRASQ